MDDSVDGLHVGLLLRREDGGVGATVLVDVLPGLQAGACAAKLPVTHHGGAVDDFLDAVPVRLGRRSVGVMQ